MSDILLPPPRKQRRFLPTDFELSTWQVVQVYCNQLTERPLNSAADIEQLLADHDEIDCLLGEYLRRLNIRITANTTDQLAQEQYEYYVKNISPHILPYYNQLQQKVVASPYMAHLAPQYAVLLRSIKKNQAIYRAENIPMLVDMNLKQKQYGTIAGTMMVCVEGQEQTMQQAHRHFTKPNRPLRKAAFEAIAERRLASKDELHTLLDQLIALRHQCALNADFDNYRDYKFAAMGRFDYTPDDCMQFHEAVAQQLLPIVDAMLVRQRQQLQLDQLRPYDREMEADQAPPLAPFANTDELIDKSIACLNQLHPPFAQYLRLMQQMGHLDLASRKDKAPGGYNTSLPETNVPFIFMNAVGLSQDIRTMLHEVGHAVHAFLEADLPLLAFKTPPSEVTELASMSMELMSMEHWQVFFEDEQQLKRAKIKQLEKILLSLPSLVLGDRFQHWLYLHPQHTHQQREQAWLDLIQRFSPAVIDWSGYEAYQAISWQQILHFYQVPFYYIEYAMAQLGAIAVWRAYRQNPTAALDHYIAALKLGYTQPIGDIYAAAGIKFDFSEAYIRELMQFVLAELNQLYAQTGQPTLAA